MAASTILGLFASFIAGNRLIDGGDLATLAQLLFQTKNNITALAGGGQVGATQLVYGANTVTTVASNNDSVMLPLALPGASVTVINHGANSLQVYGQVANPQNAGAGDTIAANNSSAQSATATGVAQASPKMATYECFALGQWKQFLSN